VRTGDVATIRAAFRLAFAVVVLCGTAWGVAIDRKCSIVIPDDAGDVTGVAVHLYVAAHALADAMQEATGVKPSVVKGQYLKAVKGQKILVGAEFAKAAGLYPKEGLSGMENVVAEKGGDIYLFGNDRPGVTNPKGRLSWEHCVLPSVKAITNFMEIEMGVAFLAPGKTGRDVPKRERIEIADGTFRLQRPTQIAGPGRYHEMVCDIANGIYGSGPIKTYGGHTYKVAVPMAKYHESHPEYFPMLGDARVSQNHMNALCISNRDVERLIVEELVRRMDEGAEIVELGQNDGNDICHCKECAAYGGVKEWGEKLWIFHRSIAEKVYALRPEKTVQIISYGATATPPRTFREFPPNVMIEMMRTAESDFREWSKYKVPRGFTNYVYLWGTYNHPGHTAKCCVPQMAECARRYLRGGVKAVYRCGYGELYGTEGQAYYVFNKILQNPDLDENAVAREYVERAYGPAAKQMAEFHDLLDSRIRGYVAMGRNISPHAAEVIAYLYPPDVLAKLEKSLVAAERTAGLSEKQVRRLKLVRLEFDYAKNLAKVIQLYHAYLLAPSVATFTPVADALRERNAMLDGFFDAKGKMKRIDGWPELKPFQGHSRKQMQDNGRLRAQLAAPFGWDADAMLAKGVLPGATARKAKVPKATERPQLGDFGAGAWAATEWNDANGIQLEAIKTKTRFKVLHDGENLYVGIESDLSEAKTFAETGRDSSCFRTDCIDMLIDPSGMRENYYHFIWNPVQNSYHDSAKGLFEDPLDPRYADDWAGWQGDWKYENVRNGDMWLTMAVIPFKTLGVTAPKPGDTWAFNVGRAAVLPDTKDSLSMELSLWSPNFENRKFTNPGAMGTLEF
jgi:hypothetical protein